MQQTSHEILLVVNNEKYSPPDSMKTLSYPRCTKVVAAAGAIFSSLSYNKITFPSLFFYQIHVKVTKQQNTAHASQCVEAALQSNSCH